MFTLLFGFALSWGAKSHRSLATHALAILKKDKSSVYNFYHVDAWSQLYTGCVDPDKVEAASGTHYYVYDGKENTGQYYSNAKRHASDESARTLLDKHYANAVKSYKAGDVNNAFLEIGRACHYVGDISCPPHAAGIQYPVLSIFTNYHKLFETYANSVMPTDESKYHATTAKSYYGTFDGNKMGVTLNDLAKRAANQKDNVKTKTESKWDQGIVATSKYGEIYTAVLLEKFYREVGGK
ncbi:phospholipase [Histomonas meleagridis]|uniref:phospholipase n=1 Tax=Histomonas meleagridis TaxID=135588 RepID=UPI003559FC3B|nr:phospholipase [Histomonas meleagridis]KAH0797190.1 phospholipase [Histomonas meleagridis]